MFFNKQKEIIFSFCEKDCSHSEKPTVVKHNVKFKIQGMSLNLTKESQKRKKKNTVVGNINPHSYSQKSMHIGPLTSGQRCYCYGIAMSEGLNAFLMLETGQKNDVNAESCTVFPE